MNWSCGVTRGCVSGRTALSFAPEQDEQGVSGRASSRLSDRPARAGRIENALPISERHAHSGAALAGETETQVVGIVGMIKRKPPTPQGQWLGHRASEVRASTGRRLQKGCPPYRATYQVSGRRGSPSGPFPPSPSRFHTTGKNPPGGYGENAPGPRGGNAWAPAQRGNPGGVSPEPCRGNPPRMAVGFPSCPGIGSRATRAAERRASRQTCTARGT